MSPQYGELRPTTGWDRLAGLGHLRKFQRVLRLGFVTACSDVVHRRTTKLCTMFGHLVGWYTIYTFSADFCPWWKFARCKLYFAFKSCIPYWQRYCTAFDQWASAELCGVVQGIELCNFCRQCHLYWAGRPSHWASAHILVFGVYLISKWVSEWVGFNVPSQEVKFTGLIYVLYIILVTSV